MNSPRTALAETSKEGEFKRTASGWRDWISKDESNVFQPEPDRYHLYVAYACPWAHRTMITRALKGLDSVISMTIVHPTWRKTKPEDPEDTHIGWIFGNPDGDTFHNSIGLGGPFPPCCPNNDPDPLFHAYSIRELYERAKDTFGKYSVPLLWDKKLSTIVNNESSEIIRMLNSEFNDFARNPQLDLYPMDLRENIDVVNEWVYTTINNGVYKCGFATTQPAYDAAIIPLTDSLDRVEGILSQQRFIAGNVFTEADIRLFVTLLRYDEVYIVYFKCNTRSIRGYVHTINYLREIYQMDGVSCTCDMDQIKMHYFTSHPTLNRFSVIPSGQKFIELLEMPHNRNNLFPFE